MDGIVGAADLGPGVDDVSQLWKRRARTPGDGPNVA